MVAVDGIGAIQQPRVFCIVGEGDGQVALLHDVLEVAFVLVKAEVHIHAPTSTVVDIHAEHVLASLKQCLRRFGQTVDVVVGSSILVEQLRAVQVERALVVVGVLEEELVGEVSARQVEILAHPVAATLVRARGVVVSQCAFAGDRHRERSPRRVVEVHRKPRVAGACSSLCGIEILGLEGLLIQLAEGDDHLGLHGQAPHYREQQYGQTVRKNTLFHCFCFY